MNYFEISRIMEDALNEVLENEDDTYTFANINSKIFNQGAKLMFYHTLLKFAEKFSFELE